MEIFVDGFRLILWQQAEGFPSDTCRVSLEAQGGLDGGDLGVLSDKHFVDV